MVVADISAAVGFGKKLQKADRAVLAFESDGRQSSGAIESRDGVVRKGQAAVRDPVAAVVGVVKMVRVASTVGPGGRGYARLKRSDAHKKCGIEFARPPATRGAVPSPENAAGGARHNHGCV